MSASNVARSWRKARIDSFHWLSRSGAGEFGQYPSGHFGETYSADRLNSRMCFWPLPMCRSEGEDRLVPLAIPLRRRRIRPIPLGPHRGNIFRGPAELQDVFLRDPHVQIGRGGSTRSTGYPAPAPANSANTPRATSGKHIPRTG